MSAKTGDTVKVHYTGKLADGTVFDSSEGRDPLTFTIGQGQVIPGFEQTIEGMQIGEEKTETIPAGSAYGQRRDELVFQVRRDTFPDHIEPEEGMSLELRQKDGEALRAKVADVGAEEVTLDANHPLAGEDLTFEIQLLEIV